MQKTDAKTVTRAEKTRRQKDIVKEFLAKRIISGTSCWKTPLARIWKDTKTKKTSLPT
jgi:hypothetical protein